MLLDFGDLSLLVLRSDVLMSWIFGHESPLVSHILSSYTKHHAPVKQIINEERTASDDQINLKIIRPLQGIDQCKQCPMVRANKHMHIALSPLSLSPNNYTRRQFKPFQPSSWIQIQD